MVDTILDPESIVIEYAEDDLEHLWGTRRLAFSELQTKMVARQILEDLIPLHSRGQAHTGHIPSTAFRFVLLTSLSRFET